MGSVESPSAAAALRSPEGAQHEACIIRRPRRVRGRREGVGRSRLLQAVRRSGHGDPRRPGRSRRARPVPHGLGQDPRLRRAGRRAPKRLRRAPLGFDPGPDEGACHPDRRRASPARSRPGAFDRAGLRRSGNRQAGAACCPCAHPGGDPGPAARPDRAARRLTLKGPHPGPRRGRQDARHGLQAGRRQDRQDDRLRPPDAALLGDARGGGRPNRQGIHHQPAPPRARSLRGAQGRRGASLRDGQPRGKGRSGWSTS